MDLLVSVGFEFQQFGNGLHAGLSGTVHGRSYRIVDRGKQGKAESGIDRVDMRHGGNYLLFLRAPSRAIGMRP
ncbi:hypothetical protein D3C80_799170 [compost metagenome]